MGEIRVSLERLTPDELAEVAARIAKLRRVRHPNLLPVRDLAIVGDEVVATHDAFPGQPLSEIQKSGPMSEARVFAIGAQLLNGLAALHRTGLVHRELSADTIWIDGDTARVAPTIAGVIRDVIARYQTRTGGYWEIHCAIAPEGFKGEPVAPTCDVYGVGAILHESLTGRPMFAVGADESPMLVLLSVARDPRPPLAIDDTTFAAAIMRAIAISPADRPQTARAMLEEMGARIDDESISDDPTELALLDAIRKEPADPATRLVYADWLEQHGYATRATFLRLDAIDTTEFADLALVATPLDAGWRTITSRAPIARCVTFAKPCHKRWDQLAPTGVDGVRHCSECAKPVYFCTTVAEARQRGAARACIAIDAAVARGDAERAYDTSLLPATRDLRGPEPIMMGAPLRDSPPIRPPHRVPPTLDLPEKPGFVDRIRGLFRRS